MTLPFLQVLVLVLLATMMLWAQGQQSVLPPDQHAALMAVYEATGPCQFFQKLPVSLNARTV
jgi:hypothetical protein